MDLVGGDIGQVRPRHGAGQFQRIGAALRQRLSGQRRQLLSERIAQFGIDKLDCAHEWRPSVCDQAKTIRQISGAASRNGPARYLAANINPMVAMRESAGEVVKLLSRGVGVRNPQKLRLDPLADPRSLPRASSQVAEV